jgi:hypothetical protein
MSGPRRTLHRVGKSASRLVTLPTASWRSHPDFLIIGAQRAGTTSLYRYLAAHPGVLPAVMGKGVHYFDTGFTHGMTWYRSHFPLDIHRRSVGRKLGIDRALTGEGSPYYSFHPAVPGRVAAAMPAVRSIFVVRDPVARAYSQYQHEVARGFETLSFEDALHREDERLAGEAEKLMDGPAVSFEHQHHSYVARGRYAEQIRRWRDHVGPQRLLVLDAGEFFADPQAGYHRVLRFLGLPERSLPEYRALNAHDYAPMSDGARRFLKERFVEPDRELAEELGAPPSWVRRIP